MMSHRQLLIVVLLVCVSLSGCQLTDQKETTLRGESDNVPRVGFDFRSSEFQINGTNFSYNGRVRFIFEYDRERPFEDTVVCLYDENGTVLNSTTIETLQPPEEIMNVSISSSEVPHSMVIDHPEFHQYPKRATVFMIHQGGESYLLDGGNFGEAQDAFPYPRHNETGRCM
jgi:hypothetical protein